MSARIRLRHALLVVLVTTAAIAISVPVEAAPAGGLTVGDRGADVIDLQSRLASVGYDPGPIDGVYGPRTAAAVKAFQRALSLAVTGEVDAATWRALDESPDGSPIMKVGDRGSNVMDLQSRLKDAGFDPGSVDGAYGPLTAGAVRALQQARNLSVTGSVDQATWDSLVGEGVALRRGDTGGDVAIVQSRLARVGFSPGAADGKFGPRTEAAVRAFQSASSLKVTGVVNKATWNALEAADTGAGEVVFETGDRGPGVVDLQTRLARVGMNPGPIDGAYGRKTAAAVTRFQRTFNLSQDGKVHQLTLLRLSSYEQDAERGYAAGYRPGGGAGQWRPLVAQVFARWDLDEEVCVGSTCIPGQVDNAITIIDCESNGVPFVVNVSSGVTGLFQHRLTYWEDRVRRVRTHFPDFPADASPYEPEHNAMVAALLVWESRRALVKNLEGGGSLSGGPDPWSHWSCRRYLS